MADIAAISTILSSVKTATEIAKLLKSSDLTLEKAEMKLKLADLISALADVKIELATVQEIIIEKDKIIKELETATDIKAKLKYIGSCYWIIDGEKKDGPFCQKCYDSEGKLIRLQDISTANWLCNNCKSYHHKRN